MLRSDFTKAIAFAAALALLAAGSSIPARAQSVEAAAEASPPVSERLVAWIVASGDNNSMPFVVIDKMAAVVSVYDAGGRLLGATPALVGAAIGDNSTPGIGDRELSNIPPEDRTTPAGRFVGEHGMNLRGEDVLWVDYDAAVSMHRVRATNPAERRLERLDSRSPRDNRISYGCINVPADFYDRHLRPRFTQARGVVVRESLSSSALDYVNLITLHACGGRAMLEAAAAPTGPATSPPPAVIAPRPSLVDATF